MKYFYELFEGLPRCGPGDNASTRHAFSILSNVPVQPYILDIGCGTGAQTLQLAKISNGKIVALDNHQPFLDTLMQHAVKEGIGSQIMPKNQSMLNMEFEDQSFDIIWSEGALYFMGFSNGLKKCNRLLKNNGFLVVTEAVYLLPDPPPPVTEYWNNEYPDISDINSKIQLIKNAAFDLISHFTIPKSAWLDNFYVPMEKRLSKLQEKYRGNNVALGVFNNMQKEINLYKTYSDYFGYEFFVMRKR